MSGLIIVRSYLSCCAILLSCLSVAAGTPTRTDAAASGCHDFAHANKTQCSAALTDQLPPLADGMFRGRVQWVFDGDTLQVRTGERSFDIRIAQIDAPERAQPYGWQAALALMDQVRDREVGVRPVEVDRYGRIVAHVDVDGRDVAQALVARGAAWCYVRRSQRSPLCEVQQQARTAGRGLWALPAAQRTPPWEWRRRSRNS